MKNTGQRNSAGRTIYQGGRGGTFVMTADGKKRYVKPKASAARPAAPAPNRGPRRTRNSAGRLIFQGPKGGLFVLVDGKKKYVKATYNTAAAKPAAAAAKPAAKPAAAKPNMSGLNPVQQRMWLAATGIARAFIKSGATDVAEEADDNNFYGILKRHRFTRDDFDTDPGETAGDYSMLEIRPDGSHGYAEVSHKVPFRKGAPLMVDLFDQRANRLLKQDF